MKKLFLASSFADVAALFVAFTHGQCKGKTVTFIPTASLPEEVNFYVATAREAFETHGLVVDELDISTASQEQIAGKLQGNDYIYVSGGNTFFLLQALQKSGADKIIREQVMAGKLYIGESAGAIVLAPDIGYVRGMDDIQAAPSLVSLSSLALIDFYPLPHHTNFPFKEAVEQIMSDFSGQIALHPFSNSQAILVSGDDITVATISAA